MPCAAWSFCILFKCKGPTQRLKTAKKSILRPLWTPYPNFWYLFFGQFVFSSKYRHVGCPEQCHVMPGPYATFSNAREPNKRLKTAKLSILRPFWTLNPNFLAILSHWLGPLGLKRLRKAHASHGKTRGPTQQLKTARCAVTQCTKLSCLKFFRSCVKVVSNLVQSCLKVGKSAHLAHNFFERMGCSGHQRSESAVLQKSESAMLYFLIFCTEVGENYVIHTNLWQQTW